VFFPLAKIKYIPYPHHHPPSSSVHGILQTRILEWVANSSSRSFVLIYVKKKKNT